MQYQQSQFLFMQNTELRLFDITHHRLTFKVVLLQGKEDACYRI